MPPRPGSSVARPADFFERLLGRHYEQALELALDDPGRREKGAGPGQRESGERAEDVGRQAGERPHPLSVWGRLSDVRAPFRPVAFVGLAEGETASGPMRISAPWQTRRERRSPR